MITPGRRWLIIHIAVCIAYNGARPDGMHAAHIDGNKLNVRADNMAWKTPKQNEADKKIHGTATVGERHSSAKLTKAQVIDLRLRYIAGETPTHLAREINMQSNYIGQVVRGDYWKD